VAPRTFRQPPRAPLTGSSALARGLCGRMQHRPVTLNRLSRSMNGSPRCSCGLLGGATGPRWGRLMGATFRGIATLEYLSRQARGLAGAGSISASSGRSSTGWPAASRRGTRYTCEPVEQLLRRRDLSELRSHTCATRPGSRTRRHESAGRRPGGARRGPRDHRLVHRLHPVPSLDVHLHRLASASGRDVIRSRSPRSRLLRRGQRPGLSTAAPGRSRYTMAGGSRLSNQLSAAEARDDLTA